MVAPIATSPNNNTQQVCEEHYDANADSNDVTHSDSYTALLQYCEDVAWQEEGPTRTSGEFVWATQKAKDTSLYHAVTADGEKSDEKNDLEDAYKVMSKMAAEYISLEKSMSDNKEENCHLPTGPLPVLKVTEERRRQLTLLQQHAPHIYREGIALCRDWLLEHYEGKEGVSMLRSAMYSHYLDHCQNTSMDPVNMASFGKAVRATFEGLRTRRLGMRGHSKYHYYGLTIKDSSPYRDILLSTQRINNDVIRKKTSSDESSESDVSTSDPGIKYSRTFVPGCEREYDVCALLQRFPSHLSVCVSRDLKLQLSGLLSLYRSHCETIIRHVIIDQLDDIGDRVRVFWRDLRADLKCLLKKPIIIDVIKLCDIQLCKTIANLLIPSFTEHQPAARLMAARRLSRDYLAATCECMQGYDPLLTEARIHVAKMFTEAMGRQSALATLCHVVRSAMRDCDDTRELISDWRKLDYDVITTDICSEISGRPSLYFYIRKCLVDFERLLAQHAYVKKHLLFAGNVLRYSTSELMSGCRDSRYLHGDQRYSDFLLNWSRAVEIITRELTLKNAPSLGRLHALGLLLTDYMMLLVGEERRAHCEATLKSRVYTGKASVDAPLDPMCTAHTRFTTINPRAPGRPSTTGMMSREVLAKLAAQQIEICPKAKTELEPDMTSELRANVRIVPEIGSELGAAVRMVPEVTSEPRNGVESRDIQTVVACGENIQANKRQMSNIKSEHVISPQRELCHGDSNNDRIMTSRENERCHGNEVDFVRSQVNNRNDVVKYEKPNYHNIMAGQFHTHANNQESRMEFSITPEKMARLSCSEIQFTLSNMKTERAQSGDFNSQHELGREISSAEKVIPSDRQSFQPRVLNFGEKYSHLPGLHNIKSENLNENQFLENVGSVVNTIEPKRAPEFRNRSDPMFIREMPMKSEQFSSIELASFSTERKHSNRLFGNNSLFENSADTEAGNKTSMDLSSSFMSGFGHERVSSHERRFDSDRFLANQNPANPFSSTFSP